MNNIDRLYFHESTVVRFMQQNHTITIGLKDAEIDYLSKCNVTIKCLDVNRIEIDDVPSELVFMEEDDGEVLTLELSSNHALIIIQWNDFKRKKRYTKSYYIDCRDVQVVTID